MKSIWMDVWNPPGGDALRGDVETDTAVVGGGLAGVLCACLLKRRGVDCAVVEARRVGSGATCNTTGKITAQHRLIYSEIEKRYGFDAAKAYLSANLRAVEAYRRMAGEFPCDFEEKTAYVYSRTNRAALEEEARLYRRMGLDPVWSEKPPIPVRTVGALGMPGQAQFNPMKFLAGAAAGLKIYQDTFAAEIRPGEVVTEKGTVRARNIVLATHYPMVNIPGLYFMKLSQDRSYVLALTGAQDPGGMYIDERRDGLSFRSYRDCLLLGGGSHRTGKPGGGWAELRRAAKAAYPHAAERCAWAAQDCLSADDMPYIGRHRANSRNLFVATGFCKWGMTGSMVAAQLLSELIADGCSRYQVLFDPSRPMLHPQTFKNVGQAALGLCSFGKRCSHMGCALKWNPVEQTWDCPCHGSRFDRGGHVIDNPAKKGISI